MTSIRVFLISVLLSTICLVNFVAAINGYRNSSREAEQLLQHQLEQTALMLQNVVLHDVHDQPRVMDDSQQVWFQVWRGERLQLHSASSPDHPIAKENGFHRLNYAGHSWLVLVHPMASGSNDTLVVAQRSDVYQNLMENMLLQSVLPIVWVLPLLGVVIWAIVSFGLRPLERLSRQLRGRSHNDFTPLALDNCPVELNEVVTSINTLLQGLSRAFEREQRFSADAAHELRTPLAALKVNLHNLSQESNVSDEVYQSLLTSTERMAHSIEQLLALYRLQPDEVSRLQTPVDLTALARKLIANSYDHWGARQQQVELLGDEVTLYGDEFALDTLLRNLLDNAIKYSPPHSQIVIGLSEQSRNRETGIALSVEDSGPGIAEASRQRVFDRFYRLGGDRHSSNTIGSGLGLSIVDHVVRLHGGHIELQRSNSLGGLSVQVWLPYQLSQQQSGE